MWIGKGHSCLPSNPQRSYPSPGPWGPLCGWRRRHCRAWSGRHSTERILPERRALSGINKKKHSWFTSLLVWTPWQEKAGSSHLLDLPQQSASPTPVTTNIPKLTTRKYVGLKLCAVHIGFCLLRVYSGYVPGFPGLCLWMTYLGCFKWWN
jgi:hypothetical protein